MNLHRRKVTTVIIAFVILCTIQIFCVASTFNSGDANEESSSETKESVIESEPATSETAEKNDTAVSPQTETSVKGETVASEMVPTQNNPTAVEKSQTNDVTTEPVTTETPELSKSSYTEDDLFHLAAAVCREAGGSSEEIQLLVANVVINRVNSPLFPNTIYGVLTQHRQYGTMWKHGVSFPNWATESVKAQCYNVAKRILDGERVCPANVIFQAEFKQGSGVYKEFDGFYFCYR